MKITFIKDTPFEGVSYEKGQSLNVSKSVFNRLVNSKAPVAKEYGVKSLESEVVNKKVNKTKGGKDGK